MAHARCGSGVPEAVGAGEAVEFGVVAREKVVMGRRGHGDDRGGRCVGHLRRDFATREDQTEDVAVVVGGGDRRHLRIERISSFDLNEFRKGKC